LPDRKCVTCWYVVEITSLDHEAKFTQMLTSLLDEHRDVVSMLADGFYQSQDYIQVSIGDCLEMCWNAVHNVSAWSLSLWSLWPITLWTSALIASHVPSTWHAGDWPPTMADTSNTLIYAVFVLPFCVYACVLCVFFVLWVIFFCRFSFSTLILLVGSFDL